MTRRSISIFTPVLCACLLAYLLPADSTNITLVDTLAVGITVLSGIWQMLMPIALKYRYRRYYLFLICTAVFTISLGQRFLIQLNVPSTQDLQSIEQAGSYAMVVKKHPDASKPDLCECRIIGIADRDATSIPWFRAGCNVTLDSNYPKVQVGDTLFLNVRLRPFSDSLLPGVFNYGTYMRRKDIYWTAFAPAHEIFEHRPIAKRDLTLGLVYRREQLLQYFERINLSKESCSMMIALVLGEKSLMDRDVKKAFQRSGGAHLLAVSGMHMGIIYWVLNFLFAGFRKWKKGNLFYFLALSVGLWLFALFAGFGPSVRRACLLFTLVLLNKLLRRRSGTFHILLAVVFLLVILFPDLPFDPGFQLSVVATMGIILFYLPLRRQIAIRNRFLKPILELILVSISAQLAVAPLCIFLFHQFQFMFILTNLILTPLITLLMLWGLVVLSVAWILPDALIWTSVADTLISGVHMGTSLVSGMDNSFVTDIPLSRSEFIWWNTCLIILALAPFFRSKRWINLAMLWCISRIVTDSYQVITQYKGKDHELITWKRGKQEVQCLKLGSEYLVLHKTGLPKEAIITDLETCALQSDPSGPIRIRFLAEEHENFVTIKDSGVQIVERSSIGQ